MVAQTAACISNVGSLIGVTPPPHNPAQPAQSAETISFSSHSPRWYSQERNDTTSPKAYPAVRRLWTLTIYPHASRRRQMSNKDRSMKRTQEDRIAATVNTTVTINHAHR
ncbi:unnamed protein product [Aspergillus oryzae]|uniref:Unnamed protein product n=1 Tax=Aspergillus oryzae var. brunneus TaxID=332754 RepID=A0ABQ6LBS9_ASPOZ|nr:unnamed protein product [Aspergillus oryzae]GMF91906.1 unnamed protein product [Aspergillus oryzae]GMG10722.1 unnamed protein product [Aspergillus oryzae]GMG55102.1 unnamed protein product [Aspergillus oryzae var. brunneus]